MKAGNEKGIRRRRRIAGGVLRAVVVLALAAGSAAAHDEPDRAGLPPQLREVRFEPPMGAPVPLELEFVDESGRRVRLGDYVEQRPVILAPVYYSCTTLCIQTLEGLARSIRGLTFQAGEEFDILAVSIDPLDNPATALAKKREIVARSRPAGGGTGWRFLTADEAAIAALTSAIGFQYTYNEKAKTYSHASGVVVLTPEGRISRALYGIDFAPRDLRLALVEASANQIGSAADRLLLFCYEYDPESGTYGAAVMRLMRLGAVATLAGLATAILVFWRREKKAAFRTRAGGSRP